MLYIYISMLETEEEKFTFAALYEEMRQICFNAALSITKNPAMAEDAVHNAFLYVLGKNRKKFLALPCGKRKSYIVLTAKHRAINLLNDNKRKNYLEEEYDVSDDLDLCSILECEESLAHLVTCIQALPEIYRAVFEMRYVQDMSNLEIAAFLGITNKAVSTRVSRARIMLQEMIEKGVANGQTT